MTNPNFILKRGAAPSQLRTWLAPMNPQVPCWLLPGSQRPHPAPFPVGASAHQSLTELTGTALPGSKAGQEFPPQGPVSGHQTPSLHRTPKPASPLTPGQRRQKSGPEQAPSVEQYRTARVCRRCRRETLPSSRSWLNS